MPTSQRIPSLPGAVPNCDFCDEFSGGRVNSFFALYGDTLKTRIIASSTHFNVIPTIGQIVEGYLLIVPKTHYRALADLPPELRDEFACIVNAIHSAVLTTYGTYIMFEHGTRGSSSGGCGVTHAHMHVLPLAASNDPIDAVRANYPCKTIETVHQIIEGTTSSSYLFYQDTCSHKYIFQTDYLPSQYVRQLLARALNSAAWDWRDA
jgi:diadenosine tetraphosphate (Ap4A) HIT family hydrolase